MIQLKLLGSVDLIADGTAESDAPLRRSKRMALLAFLAAARPRGFHRRDKVAALFWPELPADRARAALRTTLTRLRDDHGDALIRGRGADEIAVDPALLRCDVVEFDAAFAAGRFADAVALYRGSFLDGVHVEGGGEEIEQWISVERTRLHDDALRALAAMSAQAEQRGDADGAVRAAQRAVDLSPSDEQVARRLIELLVAAGNRGKAMRVYEELVRRLRADFDVEPAVETQSLIATLRLALPGAPEASKGAGVPIRRSEGEMPSTLPVATPTRRRRVIPVASVVALIAVAGWVTLRAELGHPAAMPPVVSAVAWTRITPFDRAPSGHFGARAVVDSTGDALLFLGGVQDIETRKLVPLDRSYWRLRGLDAQGGATWRQVNLGTGPGPAPRWLFGLSSDGAHDRLILHGGALGFTSPCANDTWVLHHASGIGHTPSWQRVRLRGPAPPARGSFDQVLDVTRGRLIVFAGHDCVYPTSDDTWVLAFDDTTMTSGAWTRLRPDSSAGIPLRRDNYVAAYDTAAGRMFIFGGRAATVPTGELWELDHASGTGGAPAWRPIHCTGESPALTGPGGAYDFASDSWTLFGGSDASGQVQRTVWRLHGLMHNVSACRWERLSIAEPTPAARSGPAMALLPRTGTVAVFGGEFENTPLADAWLLRRIRSP